MKTRHSSIRGTSDKDFAELDAINELKHENMKLKSENNIMRSEKAQME